jgi:colicin import membrane protein
VTVTPIYAWWYNWQEMKQKLEQEKKRKLEQEKKDRLEQEKKERLEQDKNQKSKKNEAELVTAMKRKAVTKYNKEKEVMKRVAAMKGKAVAKYKKEAMKRQEKGSKEAGRAEKGIIAGHGSKSASSNATVQAIEDVDLERGASRNLGQNTM